MQRYNEEIQRAIERIEVWQANCNGTTARRAVAW